LSATLHSHPHGTPVYRAHTQLKQTKPLLGVPADDTHMAGSALRNVCLYGNRPVWDHWATKLLVTPVSWPNSVIRCLHFQGKRET